MRIVGILACLLLAGCATGPRLAEVQACYNNIQEYKPVKPYTDKLGETRDGPGACDAMKRDWEQAGAEGARYEGSQSRTGQYTATDCYRNPNTFSYRGRTGLAACDLYVEDQRYEQERSADRLDRALRGLSESFRQREEDRQRQEFLEELRRQRQAPLICTTTYGPLGSTTTCR